MAKKKKIELSPPWLFPTPFRRPNRFSDPGYDWTEEDCARVLSMSDAELGWWEFRAIFQVGLPMAAYEEGTYFLPWALEYMRLNPRESLDCLADVVWWTSEHASRLQRNDVFGEVEARFRACLDSWTQSFEVTHFDLEACRQKGWGLNYKDVVVNSCETLSLLEALAARKASAHVAESYTRELSQFSGSAVRSAWYLELLSETRQRIKIFKGVPLNLVAEDVLRRHGDLIIKERVSLERSSTYWNDVFIHLGLLR